LREEPLVLVPVVEMRVAVAGGGSGARAPDSSFLRFS